MEGIEVLFCWQLFCSIHLQRKGDKKFRGSCRFLGAQARHSTKPVMSAMRQTFGFLLVAIERYGCLDCLVNNAGDVRQGAKVVFCSRASGAERGQEIQRRLQDSGCPGEAFYQVCDVRNEADIQRLILVTIERYGCLDCLVNNVGTAYPDTIDDVTAQDFCNLMEINVVSALLASKYALPYLRETRGNVINLGSIYGMIGAKHFLSNDTSKGAVIAMTKALAIDESKYGVRVNCISPSNIWTPLWENYANQSPDPDAVIQEARGHQLMGRFGTPEEVALGVLYLAADGTFCTGFNLVVSGGAEIGFGKKSEVDPEPGPSVKGSSQGSLRK